MKIAIIGYGNIAKKHVQVLRALGCTIIASCNRSAESNEKARAELGIDEVFVDYREMVEKIQPDGLINCVSYQNIFQVSKDLIPYQIPMLIEKPPGISLDHLKELIKAQREYGTLVQVALNRRHYGVFQQAILDAGGIDMIRSLSVEWSENPGKIKEKNGFSDEMIAKYIFANSLHGIDMLLYFGGKLAEQYILTQNDGGFFRWRMNLLGKTTENKTLQFSSSWDNPVPWRMVMEAKNSRYVFAPLETCIKINSNYKKEELQAPPHDQAYKAGFFNQAEHFIQSIKGAKNKHGLETAMPAMMIAEEMTNQFLSSPLNI